MVLRWNSSQQAKPSPTDSPLWREIRAVGPFHPAADHDIESLETIGSTDRDKTEILGVDVDVVRRRQRKADLELARQIGAIKSLFALRRRDGFVTVPDLVIGARRRN